MHKLNNMKKFIQWLAKIFKAEITVEKIVYKDKIVEVEVEKLISLDGEIIGDVTIKGNLVVTGSLNVTGGVTCLKLNEINNSNKNK
jgi:cytoskeletal protein CcmA (bactofilin family)